jgi:sugar phosphate permease
MRGSYVRRLKSVPSPDGAGMPTLFAVPVHRRAMGLRTDPRRRRWVIWGALAVAFLLVNVHRLSTAVLSADLMRAFDTTGAGLGTLHSAFFYVYAVMQVGAGVLADRFGIRRTATAGTLVMSAGGLAFGVAESYPIAFAARLCIGLGASVIYVATLRFCANWFRPDEFATMNGLTVAVSGLGGVLATTPLAVVVAAVGFRTALVGIGAAGLLVAGLVWGLARDTPTAAGLDSLAAVPSTPTLTLGAVWTNVRQVAREPATWAVGIALFVTTGLNLTVLGLWGVPYVAQLYDRSITAASTLTLLGSVGLLVGPPVVGRLSDHFGRRTGPMLVGAALYTAAYGVLAVTARPPLWVVGAVFFAVGFLVGAYVLGYTVVKNRHGSGASGVATGTVNAVSFAGAAVFPTVMGAILDAYWTGETVAGARVYTVAGYRVLFGLATACGLLSLLLVGWLHLRTGEGQPADAGDATES